MNIIRKPCAARNFAKGRNGHDVRAIVIHIIDGSQTGCDATFASNTLDMVRSAHYSVGKQGTIHQYVEESDTAFHAGRILNPTCPLIRKADGSFLNPNLYTIGIEHEGRASDTWPDQMYEASAALIAGMAQRYLDGKLTRQNCWMHRQIFSGKSCPGFVFDLDRLLARVDQLVNQTSHSTAPVNGASPVDVTLRNNVNVRREPNLNHAPEGVLHAGTGLRVRGATAGQSVDGNANWFEIVDGADNHVGRFIWAGGTDKPEGIAQTSAAAAAQP